MAPIAIDPVPRATFVYKQPPSSLSRKRANHEINSDDTTSEVPVKRLRVAFDPEVEVRIVEDVGEKSLALIRAEVGHAIRQHEAGHHEEYDNLKLVFSTSPYDEDAPSISLLRKYIQGLISNTVLLRRSVSDLVNVVIRFQWLGLDDNFTMLYIRFLGNLVSSHTGYLSPVMTMLVENFANISTSAGQSRDIPVDRTALRGRVHIALKHIHNLVPSSSGMLAGIFASSFPPPTKSKRVHLDYCKNLLKATEYAPELKSDILGLIVERLIKIDVQVQMDVQDLEDNIADDIVQGEASDLALHQRLYEEDDDEDDEDDFSDVESVSSDESVDPEQQRIKDLRSAVVKIDNILDLLFAFYETPFVKNSSHDAQVMFDQLLSQFRKTVLPTYRSRHTQFILFHFAQKSHEFSTQFINACMGILTDKARSSVLRVSAAAYLASFVSRAKHIDYEVVQSVVRNLLDYSGRLRREYAPNCRGPEPRRYEIYYATFQTLIYIFCFRWRDLLADPEEYLENEEEDIFDAKHLDWAAGLKEGFTQNFMSKLNPLKICAPEIVEEFDRITHHLQFAYIHPIVENNKRIRLSQFVSSSFGPASRETSLSHMNSERNLQLEAYFPFDPYHLPVSKRWLSDDYNEYRNLPGLPDDVEDGADDSSDDEQDDLEELEDEGTETPEDSD